MSESKRALLIDDDTGVDFHTDDEPDNTNVDDTIVPLLCEFFRVA